MIGHIGSGLDSWKFNIGDYFIYFKVVGSVEEVDWARFGAPSFDEGQETIWLWHIYIISTLHLLVYPTFVIMVHELTRQVLEQVFEHWVLGL